jgi:signal transduction histidine kinase
MDPADKTVHALKNQLGIVIGFAELLVMEADRDDPRRRDLEEIHKAATAALALVVEAFGNGKGQ